MKNFFSALKKRKAIIGIVVGVAAAATTAYFIWGNKASASDYITAKVERGSVDVSVSATGTVQAVTTVQVGSQVSGAVQWLGADFNTEVKRGQVIARLDPTVFQAQVDNARANVTNAEAAVQAAETEITNQQANLAAARANQEVTRVQRDDALALVKRYQEIKNVIAGRDIEAAQANANAAAARYQQAAAQVNQAQAANAAAKAKVVQAQAALAQARAQLQQATANLDHSIITSPIDGVVISRNVDVGQTVAASLQAPTLFTIANDLTKMQVLASIDEADVGQIKQGIKANFTVDAFANETFAGEITQLRLNAQTVQNVVTYNAVIEVANPEMKLRPGMTANITIPVNHRENVLTIPNAALRFRPNLSEQEQAALREKMEERRKQREAQRGAAAPDQAQGAATANQEPSPRPGQQQEPAPQQGQPQPSPQGRQSQPPGQATPGGGQTPAANATDEGQRRQAGQMVWVLISGKTVEPRFVRTGLTNGRVTEIVSGDIHEGDTVIIGQTDAGGNNNRQQPTSPFTQRPGGGPRGR
ncbi:MAG: efflux RND transporter periplasmic adaptor subunit [Acidobacteria bacterium]|nr:efflux RND transporter periplasmic adaptor subunit [Acidobacteriota bacterium]